MTAVLWLIGVALAVNAASNVFHEIYSRIDSRREQQLQQDLVDVQLRHARAVEAVANGTAISPDLVAADVVQLESVDDSKTEDAPEGDTS